MFCESWFVIFVIQLWTLMIDLTLIHWNISLVAILSIISIFKFLSLVHSCIGTFFIFSTSTCFCTSHIVSYAGTSSGVFAYSTSTPNKLDHRLWSYCNVWQDRYWNFICITQPSNLERVWNNWIFHKVLTPSICCGRYARSIICWYLAPAEDGGFYLSPMLALKALPPQFFSCVGL